MKEAEDHDDLEIVLREFYEWELQKPANMDNWSGIYFCLRLQETMSDIDHVARLEYILLGEIDNLKQMGKVHPDLLWQFIVYDLSSLIPIVI